MHLFLLDKLIWDKFIQAFCWMLLHSLWQGLLVTVICGATIMLTKKYSPLFRYNILLILFFLFLSGCASTFIIEYLAASHTNNYASAISNRLIPISVLPAMVLQRLLLLFNNFCSANASMLVIIWFVIFLIKTGRMMGSINHARLLRNYETHAINTFWQNKLQSFRSKLQITKPVILLESALIKIPVVMGFLKPVILLPVALVNQLPAEQVEAILLHELAHIRRNDYLVNFLQHITESVFFFNPALLWMSALLREERENCCDDIALDLTKNKKQFLEALISFKEHTLLTPAYATAFPGTKSDLLHRFTRIITNKNRSLDFPGRLFLLLSLVAGCILIVAVASREHSTMTSNLKHPNQQDTFIVPLEIVKQHVDKYVYDNFSAASKKAATADKKRQRRSSKAEEIIGTSITDEKEQGDLEIDNEVFADDSHYEITSAALNENEKMQQDARHAILLKKQAEMDAMQAIRYLQQVDKQYNINHANCRLSQNHKMMRTLIIREKNI
ncbi:MAG: M56 family metallopeptidase [Chitinophagaceae bacterium]